MTCLTDAWTAHAPELRGWLRRRVDNPALADDLLQDLFLKALGLIDLPGRSARIGHRLILPNLG